MPELISHLAARQNYDRLSRWYDSFSASEKLFTKSGLQLLDVQPAEHILEIGFGTGHALIELAHAVGDFGSVCGVDISPGMFAIARRRVQQSGLEERINLHLGDATRLPLPDHQFQAVFMGFTLELFETSEIPLVLAECQRVLHPGGRLGIVSLAKKENRAVKIYEWFHNQIPGVVDCRPIFIRQELEDAGFEVGLVKEKTLWGLPAEAVLAWKGPRIR